MSVEYPFLCFDTEDNSKELLQMGRSGFDKAVTQFAGITADGEKFYIGNPVPPPECFGRIGEKLTGDEQNQVAEYFVIQAENSKNVVEAGKNWLRRAKEKFCYAHNLQYDLGNLFADELDALDSTLVGGRLIKAGWGKKMFVDTFNMWPMKASMIGKAFGIDKLVTKSMSTDKEYVYRDVEIIRQAMLFAWQFRDKLALTNLPPTLGGLCVKVWKAWGGINCHDSSEMARDALYGGRVELFKERNDSDKVAYVDINSLYPAMMLKEFPGPLGSWDKKEFPRFGVAECSVEVSQTELPTLPYRDEDGRILYPTGKFKGTWTIAELNDATANGTKITKIHSILGTDEGITPYRQFVERLYSARLASKSEAEKLFFKLLMNNLYGRLGTSGVIGRTVWQTEKNRDEGIPFGEKVLVKYAMPLPDETNWLHAAYVTAYGRLELLRHMRLIGAKNMIYCDTDSCIFDCPSGKLPFETGSELGVMKIEKMCGNCKNPAGKDCCAHPTAVEWWKACRTYAPKMYQTGNIYKAKGVPKHLAKQFILTGAAQFDLPFKLREAIRFFDAENARKLSVWRTVEKRKRGDYDKKKLKNNRYYPLQILRD